MLEMCALRRIRDTGWVSVYTRMEGTSKAHGRMTSDMERAMKSSVMEMSTVGITAMVKCQARVFIIGQMVIFMTASGVRARSMDTVSGEISKEIHTLASG